MTYDEHHWTDDAACPVFSTVIPATGPDTNVFAILGTASRLLRELDVPTDRIAKLREDVMSTASYGQAVAFVEYWFRVDSGDGER